MIYKIKMPALKRYMHEKFCIRVYLRSKQASQVKQDADTSAKTGIAYGHSDRKENQGKHGKPCAADSFICG